MFVPESPRWLAEVHDRVGQGFPLEWSFNPQRSQRDRLASGFVGCNLVADLTYFFWGVLRGWRTALVAPDLFYCDLQPWLRGPATEDPKNPEELVGEEAAAQLQTHALGEHPWRLLNSWLARETVSRLAKKTVSAAACRWKLQTFQQILLQSGLEPAACRCCSDRVVQGFGDWWNATGEKLVELLEKDIRHRIGNLKDPEVQRQELGRLLARELPAEPLIVLLGQKNVQLTLCVGQLNRDLTPPRDPAWIGRMTSRILGARQADDDLVLDRKEGEELLELLRWMEANGLGRRFRQASGGLTETFLGRSIRAPDSRGNFLIPAPALPRFLQEWKEVERILRTRGLPADWRSRRPVEDLFFHPLPVRFAAWRRYASYFGL